MVATRKIGLVIAALLAVAGIAGTAFAADNNTPTQHVRTSVPHRY